LINPDEAARPVMIFHLDHHRVEPLDVRVKASGVLAQRVSLCLSHRVRLSAIAPLTSVLDAQCTAVPRLRVPGPARDT
jgi:hypothetical protein